MQFKTSIFLSLAALLGTISASDIYFSCTGRPDGNYPDPDDCSRFYSCVDQTYAYSRYCGKNRLYSIEYDECHFPYEVDCAGRVRPEGLDHD